VLVRERAQRLGGHLPAGRLHGQLAAATRHDLALDGQQVADVDELLEPGQALLTEIRQRQHHLQLGPVPLTEPDEAELAGVAQEDHPAGHRDLLTGLGVGLQVLAVVLVPQVLQQVRPRHRDRVRLHSFRQQAVTLLQADPHLLGQVVLPAVGVHRVHVCVSHA
jgi:hypothetical protein